MKSESQCKEIMQGMNRKIFHGLLVAICPFFVRFVHRPSNELAVVDPDGEDENNLTGKVDVVRSSGIHDVVLVGWSWFLVFMMFE